LPGRKSDVKDAHWIAQCLQKDLIKGSFVPDEVLQQMRQLTRQCLSDVCVLKPVIQNISTLLYTSMVGDL
jgi:hypothetical protein